MPVQPLKPEQLYTVCDPAGLRFASTTELRDLEEVVGQQRAVEAIAFGVGIQRPGYNLYALGPTGSGKRSVVQRFVESKAATETVPQDWCYVNNFADPHKPNAIGLPAGTAASLRKEMLQLVEELRRAVPEALESDAYRARLQEIEDALKEKQEELFETLQKEAHAHDITMLRTPTGFAFAPMRKGEVIKPDEYEKLSASDKQAIEQTVARLQEDLERLIQQVPRWRRESQAEVHQLNRDVVMSAVGQLIDELRRQFSLLPEVLTYLDAVQQDVIDHADQFRRTDEMENPLAGLMMAEQEHRETFVNRYAVNILVDNSGTTGAPVVYVDNPTYPILVGRVEHRAQLGALITDFTMIKPGALHQANGGYLILDARKVLLQPYAWDGLKRVLQSGKMRIESLGQVFSLVSTVSLEPEDVPVAVKIVLLGDRSLYYLLSELDPDFAELFKVAVDFDDIMSRTPEDLDQYARLIATLCRREELHPMDPSAVARVIEHSSRLVEDTEKLSTRFGRIADLLREADYWAATAGSEVVAAGHVQQAIDTREQRQSRIRERWQEETQRGVLLIDTAGEGVGQVNGLSVAVLGEYAFGHPSRITASARVGKGEVVDIEREIELGGPIHSKGILILSGFLSGRYCPEQPLSVSASLVLEQTYGGVEGDSASAAELFALLSALASAPVRQAIAVTGSINQHGQIQAIGGVNEKIEGFYDVCAARDLSGDQGVIIPHANIEHLMLRKDIVDAVSAGRFNIWAIKTVDEGMELLTGIEAGARNEQGEYPADSINRRVEDKLRVMAEQARRHEEESDD
ncbi:MAG: AAA family ATPase [Acidiferrobacteraceae bacterium]|jgi:lon-related putative ATP-dependent protease